MAFLAPLLGALAPQAISFVGSLAQFHSVMTYMREHHPDQFHKTIASTGGGVHHHRGKGLMDWVKKAYQFIKPKAQKVIGAAKYAKNLYDTNPAVRGAADMGINAAKYGLNKLDNHLSKAATNEGGRVKRCGGKLKKCKGVAAFGGKAKKQLPLAKKSKRMGGMAAFGGKAMKRGRGGLIPGPLP